MKLLTETGASPRLYLLVQIALVVLALVCAFRDDFILTFLVFILIEIRDINYSMKKSNPSDA